MLDKREVKKIAEEYTVKVCKNYKPKQIIMFGSYVNGNPHKDSDIDIAVIFDNVEGDWLETWGNLIGLREGISYDIETHMLDETCNRSGFLDHIRKTGDIIYQQER
jgi:predicted nucleotidyltransferase